MGITPVPPFVIIEEERIAGFNIDLWEEMAQLAELPFEYTVDEVNEKWFGQ